MNEVIDLANGIFGEAASEDYNTMLMVGSSAINRLKSNRPQEFGSNLQEVLQKGYYAVSNPNEPYKQALTQQFPDKDSENKYKVALQIASGLIKGTIKPTEGQFYFTSKEIKKLKKSFKFEQVKSYGKTGKYEVFGY